jgi:hypothetical protein
MATKKFAKIVSIMQKETTLKNADTGRIVVFPVGTRYMVFGKYIFILIPGKINHDSYLRVQEG